MFRFLQGIALALCFAPGAAFAQHVTETFISFETDCAGAATPNSPNLLGYKEVPSSLYAPCGLLSATSGGTFGKQQLYDPVLGTIAGMDGNVAFAGAFTLDALNITFGEVELVFSPAINELALDALELGNATGLTIELLASDGSSLGTFNPMADAQQKLHFEQTSLVPIAKVLLDYSPAFLDGWFIDSLRFNVSSCGDGEVEPAEDCDDGNTVECDRCGNDCRATLDGCLDGNTCVADGSVEPDSAGCAVCDLSARQPGNDVGYTDKAPGTACDDGRFCSVDEQCDGAGACVGTDRDCGDTLGCTLDTCDEANDACKHEVGSGCFIDAACHATGDRNPDAPCEACDPAQNPTGWTTLENGETCGQPSCEAGTLTPAPLCGAGGDCVAQTPIPCDGSVCADPLSCVDGCKEDDDCLEEYHCTAGACVPDDMQGGDCERDAECGTGHCADGVCCDRACSGTCESCDEPGAVGVCTIAEVGTDPDDECDGAGVCSAEQTCVTYEVRGNGLCAVPPAPTGGDFGLVVLALVGLVGAVRRRRTA